METGAQTAPAKNRFDQTDRERIRRALLRYMQQHAVGVPTLQKEIATANKLGLDRVPLKTLQRFLGNTHRSNDAMVRFCHQFAEALLEDDPLDRLGEELAAFHAVSASNGEQISSLPSLEQCSGTFEGIGPVQAKGIVAYDPQKVTKVSALTLSARRASPFMRAAEIVSNWRYEAEPQGPARRSYEGVAVMTSTGLLVALRNNLTGAPRTYWLAAGPEGLAGQGAEPFGPLDRAPPSVFDRVAFERLTFQRMAERADG
ncbi:conserved hypothetical protein [Hyphomicrobiales bacterium]|nr:conserved hypothetical protein [Hyphomicrobiales bacterium]CAH1698731.1 conserved hypothetical protein [Hyphomicrobiales bacterium]CAI0342379.1 conserved hypothetical protein [Hyphomicrobiales bacterium]